MRLLPGGIAMEATTSLVSATVPMAVAVVVLAAGVLLGRRFERLRWPAKGSVGLSWAPNGTTCWFG